MKLKFLTVAFGISFFLMNIDAFAQVYRGVNAGAGSTIVRAKSTDSNIEGSFYLFDDWKPGKVEFSDGSEPQTKDIKFDVVDNLLVVKGDKDTESTFVSPVSKFFVQENGKWLEFRKGFTGKDLNEGIFIQVIHSSPKSSFFKKESKTVIESKGYNTATVTKKIETTSTYYLQQGSDKQLTLAKRDNKSLISLLNKPEIDTFLKANKLNLKRDEDLIKLFTFYDTL